jgi:hypothetical protein
MCSVILKSEKHISEIPCSWRFGIDIMKEVQTEGTNAEVFSVNSGSGTAMCGGPICRFNGIDIPCFVCTSPKASITSQLLADMLQFLDGFNIFDRTDNNRPFLLLDGHHSRLDLPFIDYIHGNGHEWVACIGVPYGTHLWQVADSPQLNGSFKTELVKAKRQLFRYKQSLGKSNFEPTDIIPLINRAWPASFGNVKNSAKAIAVRGWGPLNYCLLQHQFFANDEKNSEIDSSESSILDLSTINTRTGIARDYLDQLIVEGKKDDGRIERWKRQHQDATDKNEAVKKLKSLTKLTSTQLATVSNYHLCPETYNHIKEHWETMDNRQNEINIRKNERKRAMIQKYLPAREKVLNNQSISLSGEDLKSLLQYHRRKDDSPIKSRIADRRLQWEHRQHRVMEDPAPSIMMVEMAATQGNI